VLEHIFYPKKFMLDVSKSLKLGQIMFFSVPNLREMVNRKYTNALNFEHTYYITEPVIEYLLAAAGYSILEKKYYDNHSIFYAAERAEFSKETPKLYENLYNKNKTDYLSLVNYYRSEVDSYNKLISNHDGDVFLFGAHIFSQFLLYMGLDSSRIISILDNSPQKIDKRLYGSTLKISSPNLLESANNPMVILKVGQYFNEIKDQIIFINKNVIIVE